MMNFRKQLTLFVPKKDAEIIELVRSRFNPKQRDLIDAHITLCREDEIGNLEKVIENINQIKNFRLKINFGIPEKFKEKNGIYLSTTNTNEFDELRKKIILKPRKQNPHITLMHPRNSEYSDEIFEEIKKIHFPNEISFNKISLIEQKGDRKWEILKNFKI